MNHIANRIIPFSALAMNFWLLIGKITYGNDYNLDVKYFTKKNNVRSLPLDQLSKPDRHESVK